MSKIPEIRGLDIPTGQLQPLNERPPGERSFKRLLASIRAVGLIEPLCVYKDDGHFIILDGYLRYRACLEIGIEKIPCLVYKTKEAYSFNKMVNHLSPVQEHRMLKKSLEILDEKTIARALGIASLSARLKDRTLNKISATIAKEYDSGRITRTCIECLTYVKPEQQDVILKEMIKAGDFTPAFARAMIIRTPAKLRAKLPAKRKNPWDQEGKKQELLQRLSQVEERYDFYTGLYRQYVADLMRLCIYIRKLVTNERIKNNLEVKHPEILRMFNTILYEAGETGQAAA